MEQLKRGDMDSIWTHRLRVLAIAGILALVAVGVALATGCGDTSGTEAASGGGAPKVVVYDLPYFPYTDIDPGKEYWFNVYHSNVYEQLTTLDQDGNLQPQLATSWEGSNGGKTWTFQLRQGVKFQSGTEFTSADVKFSIERGIETGAGGAFLWHNFKSVSTPDKYTAVLNFSKPMPGADMSCGVDPPTLIYSKEAFERLGKKAFEAGTECAGTGPYMLVKSSTTETDLKRFPDYWGGWTDTHAKAPDLAVIRQVTEPSVMMQQLQNGDAQMVAGIPATSVDSVKSDPNLKFMSKPWWVVDFFFINTKTTPSADLNLRKALYYAFPYEQVRQLVYKNLGVPASGGIPQGLGAYEQQNQELGIPKQDMAKAQAALAQSKYPNGGVKLLTLVDEGVASNMQVAQLFKAAAAELNITLDVRYQNTAVITNRAMSDNPPQSLYISTYGMYYRYTAQQGWMFISADNPYTFSYVHVPQVDTLLSEGEQLEATDAQAGGAKVVEAGKLAQEQYSNIWVINPNYRAATAKNITWAGYNPMMMWFVPFYDVQVN